MLQWGLMMEQKCELVRNFPLDKISVEYDKNSIGLYHDNGLSIFKNIT